MDVYFCKFAVTNQVFFRSKFTYALVNLKPLVPGHVLVVPYRTSVLRFADLNHEESIDYMNTLQLVHKFILHIYKADSMNLAIQDGPEAGQSVPHLHTHLIPRFKTDGHGDNIHQMMEKADLHAAYEEFFARRKSHFENGTFNPLKDEDRQPRSAEVMAKEAKWLSEELEKFKGNENSD